MRTIGFSLLTVMLSAVITAAGERGKTVAELFTMAADPSRTAEVRTDALERLARRPEAQGLVTKLRVLARDERDSSVRLAIHFALASHGERQALYALLKSLDETGHRGAVYLDRLGEVRHGWDKAAWQKYIDGKSDAEWRALILRRRLPRRPTDADAKGLEAARRWWDGLGFPDLGELPFIRYVTGITGSEGSESYSYNYAFLIGQSAEAITVFTTDLDRRRIARKTAEGVPSPWARYEKLDLHGRISGELRGTVGTEDQDPLGIARVNARRFRGFLLARALIARGHRDLAIRVWKKLASRPGLSRYGPWSGLKALQAETRRQVRYHWELRFADPRQSFAAQLHDYRRYLLLFQVEPDDDDARQTVPILKRMAAEEAARSKSVDETDKSHARQIARLIERLPLSQTPDAGKIQGPYRELVQIGPRAIPALAEALSDARFSRVSAPVTLYAAVGSSFRLRILRVRELARLALMEITGECYRDLRDARERALDWWRDHQKK